MTMTRDMRTHLSIRRVMGVEWTRMQGSSEQLLEGKDVKGLAKELGPATYLALVCPRQQGFCCAIE